MVVPLSIGGNSTSDADQARAHTRATMRSILLILGRAAALSAVLVAAPLATAGSVLADHCAPEMPAHPREVRGFTFTARVVALEGVGTVVTPTIRFAVDHVYAGAGVAGLERGRDLAVVTSACGGIEILGMSVGDQVLVSSNTLTDGPSTVNSAVWKIAAGHLRLLTFGEPGAWPTSDRRIQAADTLREALALVAPGVVVPPDTATAAATAPGPTPDGEPPLLPFALVGSVSLLVSAAWRRNRHTPPQRALASPVGVERPV